MIARGRNRATQLPCGLISEVPVADEKLSMHPTCFDLERPHRIGTELIRVAADPVPH